eukprot:GEMP01002253.1.p1 GENE.GEMP01002253.1~~GEMP01002253.1.p1  ORF type:complete len:1249 (+),score=215.66 GEMP01002253.1:77-3823(+)
MRTQYSSRCHEYHVSAPVSPQGKPSGSSTPGGFSRLSGPSRISAASEVNASYIHGPVANNILPLHPCPAFSFAPNNDSRMLSTHAPSVVVRQKSAPPNIFAFSKVPTPRPDSVTIATQPPLLLKCSDNENQTAVASHAWQANVQKGLPRTRRPPSAGQFVGIKFPRLLGGGWITPRGIWSIPPITRRGQSSDGMSDSSHALSRSNVSVPTVNTSRVFLPNSTSVCGISLAEAQRNPVHISVSNQHGNPSVRDRTEEFKQASFKSDLKMKPDADVGTVRRGARESWIDQMDWRAVGMWAANTTLEDLANALVTKNEESASHNTEATAADEKIFELVRDISERVSSGLPTEQAPILIGETECLNIARRIFSTSALQVSDVGRVAEELFLVINNTNASLPDDSVLLRLHKDNTSRHRKSGSQPSRVPHAMEYSRLSSLDATSLARDISAGIASPEPEEVAKLVEKVASALVVRTTPTKFVAQMIHELTRIVMKNGMDASTRADVDAFLIKIHASLKSQLHFNEDGGGSLALLPCLKELAEIVLLAVEGDSNLREKGGDFVQRALLSEAKSFAQQLLRAHLEELSVEVLKIPAYTVPSALEFLSRVTRRVSCLSIEISHHERLLFPDEINTTRDQLFTLLVKGEDTDQLAMDISLKFVSRICERIYMSRADEVNEVPPNDSPEQPDVAAIPVKVKYPRYTVPPRERQLNKQTASRIITRDTISPEHRLAAWTDVSSPHKGTTEFPPNVADRLHEVSYDVKADAPTPIVSSVEAEPSVAVAENGGEKTAGTWEDRDNSRVRNSVEEYNKQIAWSALISQGNEEAAALNIITSSSGENEQTPRNASQRRESRRGAGADTLNNYKHARDIAHLDDSASVALKLQQQVEKDVSGSVVGLKNAPGTLLRGEDEQKVADLEHLLRVADISVQNNRMCVPTAAGAPQEKNTTKSTSSEDLLPRLTTKNSCLSLCSTEERIAATISKHQKAQNIYVQAPYLAATSSPPDIPNSLSTKLDGSSSNVLASSAFARRVTDPTVVGRPGLFQTRARSTPPATSITSAPRVLTAQRKAVAYWTPRKVSHWLKEQLDMAAEVQEIFLDQEISGKVLLTMMEEDMVRIGIRQFGRRRTIALGIQELIQKERWIQQFSLHAPLRTSASFPRLRSDSSRVVPTRTPRLMRDMRTTTPTTISIQPSTTATALNTLQTTIQPFSLPTFSALRAFHTFPPNATAIIRPSSTNGLRTASVQGAFHTTYLSKPT